MIARAAATSITSAALALGGCTSTSPEEFVEIVEEARSCQDGDSCELAGEGPCTCPTPVNASAVASVDEAAMDVACEGAVADCVSHQNIRCEDGRCRSDESP